MKPAWYWVIGWLLSIVTVIGNGLVIYLITTRKRLYTRTNSFVLSLAVIDCLIGAIYFPVFYACDGSTWCNRRIFGTFTSFLVLTSVANLCAMILDRYVAIVEPLSYTSFMTTRRVVLLISAAWGFPLICHLLPKTLLLLKGEEDLRIKLMSSLQFLFEFGACVFMLFATARILLVVRKHSRQVATLATQLRLNGMYVHSRDHVYSAKFIVALVGVFILCFSIAQYYNLQNLFQLQELPYYLRLCLRLLFVTNSAANPLVYAFLKKDMKKEMRDLCSTSRQQHASETNRSEERRAGTEAVASSNL